MILPDLQEQQAFPAKVERLTKLAPLQNEAAAFGDAFFKSLQHRAFSGQL